MGERGRDGTSVELIGPAGCGKTTLLEALRRLPVALRPGVAACDLSCAPAALRAALRLPPGDVARALVPGRASGAWWGPRDTLRSMTYLESWLDGHGGGSDRAATGEQRQRAPDGRQVVVYDHGPFFRIATLAAEGPSSRPRFRRWWEAMREAWSDRLSLAVWLDAPDRVLIERIRRRERAHPCKAMDDAAAAAWLQGYREALSEALAPLAARRPQDLLRFDTAALGPDEVAAALLPRLREGA